MAPQDNLEHYEATEAQDLTRLLRALRPPERAVQVPPPVDLTIRAEIWKVPLRRQVSTLLSMARWDLIRVIWQALTDNPLLEEGARAGDEHAPAGGEHAPPLTAAADDLTDAEERYDSIWQACVPDGWDAHGLPSQADEARYTSEPPSGPPEAIVPDVIVTRVGEAYQVVLNEEDIPRLRLSATYRRLVREGQGGEPEVKQYLDDKLRAAVWLIRCLDHRRQTLLKVATSLVTWQRDFFDHGLALLKPLVLKDVAEDIGMHESTVSRVTTNKYMYTEQGIFELKYFFHSGIELSGGGETMSSLTVKDRIKKLVAAEDPGKPLTDQQLVEMLAAEHDLDQLLQLASERVVTLLDIEGASVILLDEARQEPYFKVAYDRRVGHGQRLREVRFPADQGIPGWVIHEGQSLIVPDVDQDPRYYRGVDDHTGTRTRSIAAVPLRTRDRTIGVLEAINKINGVFTIEDVRLLEAFANQLAPALEKAHLIQELRAAQERLSEENRYWREATEQTMQFETLVGESPRMQEVYRLVKRVLNTTATVLLTGERGTGKELIARVIHYEGPRAKGPFIAVNCAAIPETLLEAELRGYERGAFTGATQRKPGRFELASGGTLFLDEIADMSPVLQAKLLRVLQEKEFERVGRTETLTHNARIVAASNQDLERLVAEGKFRHDLYDRLNVYPIALPPLRERPEDLGPLTMHFLKRFSQELRNEVLGISKEAMGLLERYPWPGNVRELEEVIEQAVARCLHPTVRAQDLPRALREQARVPAWSGEAVTHPPGGIAMADLEKHLIRQALEQAHGNKSHAAKQLGLSRTQLRTRMRRYGLETD